MATLTRPAITSRHSQQGPPAGTLSQTPQNSRTSTMITRSQANAQLSAPRNNGSQLSQSPGRSAIQQPNIFSQAPAGQMASAKPSTPGRASMPLRDSPGTWKHPRAEEIARRQRQSTFNADNVTLIVRSAGAVIGLEVLRRVLPDFIWSLTAPIHRFVGNIPLWSFWLFITWSLLVALYPLYIGPDQLLDIDLTATQRSLLGLDPNATPPATPNTRYATPPRYTRSVTPRSGTPGSRGSSPAGSPLAYKDGSGYKRGNESSPRRGSIGGVDSRSQSFGLGASSFGTPSKEGSLFAPQTPSPIGRASGITFSNKWLYHKGRTGSLSRDSF